MTIDDQKTAAMEGDFIYVGLDIDSTGLRLIDEVSMREFELKSPT